MANKVILIWNITQDIDIKNTANGQGVANFWMATNESYKDKDWNRQEKTEFHNMVVWGKPAEVLAQYCGKWSKLYIEWKLQTRTWDDQDWTKRYKTEINIEKFEFLSTKPKEGTEATEYIPRPKVQDDNISIEEIPF